jgi:hypothetical protein
MSQENTGGLMYVTRNEGKDISLPKERANEG